MTPRDTYGRAASTFSSAFLNPCIGASCETQMELIRVHRCQRFQNARTSSPSSSLPSLVSCLSAPRFMNDSMEEMKGGCWRPRRARLWSNASVRPRESLGRAGVCRTEDAGAENVFVFGHVCSPLCAQIQRIFRVNLRCWCAFWFRRLFATRNPLAKPLHCRFHKQQDGQGWRRQMERAFEACSVRYR